MQLRKFQAQDIVDCPCNLTFLHRLGGPSEIFLEGKDTQRTRVFVTLLHANEPSGLNAILQYLQSKQTPATNSVFIIASVNAALTAPVFFHRMLPGTADLNRCFSVPPANLQGALAQAILAGIHQYSPELIIDMHNTSGDGPAFCVATKNTPDHATLAAYFSRRLIVTDIELGSLMEQDFGWPVITFEAGGSDTPQADISAFEGLSAVLTTEPVFKDNQSSPEQKLDLLTHPRRLELCDNFSIAYDHDEQLNFDLTLAQNIEHFNFGITPAHTVLGWTHHEIGNILTLDEHKHTLDEFFSVENSQLVTKKALRLFMVTTRADIARSDCLFYFIAAD